MNPALVNDANNSSSSANFDALVVIILLNWNRYEDTRKCIGSLREIKYSNFKIILVDNASADESGEKLSREFEEVIFIPSRQNLGFAGGNNLGIKYALEIGADYVLLLNNDTVVTPNFLTPLVEVLSSEKHVAAVQPKIFYMDRPEVTWSAGGRFLRFLGWSTTIADNDSSNGIYDIDWITGCCLLVKSSVIKEVGCLNDRYFMYYEDVDWSLRMKEAQYRLKIQGTSAIYHKAGSSVNQINASNEGKQHPMVHYWNSRNHIWLIKNHLKWYEKPTAYLFTLSKSSLLLAYLLLMRRFNKASLLIRGVTEGLRTTAGSERIC